MIPEMTVSFQRNQRSKKARVCAVRKKRFSLQVLAILAGGAETSIAEADPPDRYIRVDVYRWKKYRRLEVDQVRFSLVIRQALGDVLLP